MHVLPKGFHRIRHYGLFADGDRAANIARALLGAAPHSVEPAKEKAAAPDAPRILPCPCPRCGGRMIVIEVFALRAETSTNVCVDANQDRHIMTAARVCGRKGARIGRRSSAGDDPARPVASHPSLAASRKQPLEAFSARPATCPPPPSKRPRPLRLAQSTIPTMPAAAKSP
jgi:hypothetical protein